MLERIWIWFADNGNIRKWQREPFEEGTEFVSTVTPAEVGGLVDAQTEARATARDIESAIKLREAAAALAARDAELAAVKENCETVCNSYADENQRLYDRAERAEAELARRDMQLEASAKVALDLSAQLAEAIDLLGSSLCEMAPISAENHKRRVIEFITARRSLEAQGGENG